MSKRIGTVLNGFVSASLAGVELSKTVDVADGVHFEPLITLAPKDARVFAKLLIAGADAVDEMCDQAGREKRFDAMRDGKKEP